MFLYNRKPWLTGFEDRLSPIALRRNRSIAIEKMRLSAGAIPKTILGLLSLPDSTHRLNCKCWMFSTIWWICHRKFHGKNQSILPQFP